MDKITQSSWQSSLIALGLLIMIPATVWLGINFLAPKVEWKQYYKLQREHFKQCPRGKDGIVIDREKCDKEWNTAQADIFHSMQVQNRSKFEIMTSGPLVFALIAVSGFINVTIIAASLIGSAVIVHMIYYTFSGNPVLPTLTVILRLVMALASLMLVLWYAYRDSRE